MKTTGSIISITIIGILGIISLSCGRKNATNESEYQIDIAAIIDTPIESSLEELGYKGRTIQLETDSMSLLPAGSNVIGCMADNYFINGKMLLYRFSSTGKFLNTIGRLGNGPMEHSTLYSASFNASDSTIHLYTGNNRIIIWSIDGRPLKEISLQLEQNVTTAYVFTNGYWGETKHESNDNKDTVCIVWFDMEGIPVKTDNLISIDRMKDVSYYTVPMIFPMQDAYGYLSDYTSTLYKITPSDAIFLREFNMGKYGMDMNKIGDMEYRQQVKESTAQILDIRSGNEMTYTFLIIRKGRDLYGVILNNEGQCLYCQQIEDPRREGGILLSRESGLRVWPTYINGSTLYTLVADENVCDEENPSLLILTKGN